MLLNEHIRLRITVRIATDIRTRRRIKQWFMYMKVLMEMNIMQ